MDIGQILAQGAAGGAPQGADPLAAMQQRIATLVEGGASAEALIDELVAAGIDPPDLQQIIIAGLQHLQQGGPAAGPVGGNNGI